MELVPNTPSSQALSYHDPPPSSTSSTSPAHQKVHDQVHHQDSRMEMMDDDAGLEDSILGPGGDVVDESMTRSYGESYLKAFLPSTQLEEGRVHQVVAVGRRSDGPAGMTQRSANRGDGITREHALLVQGTSSADIAQNLSERRFKHKGGASTSASHHYEEGDLDESYRSMPGMNAFHPGGGDESREERDEEEDVEGDGTCELMGEMTMEMTRVGGGIQLQQDKMGRSTVDDEEEGDDSAAQNSTLLSQFGAADESTQVKIGCGDDRGPVTCDNEQVSPSQKENAVPSVTIARRPSPSPTSSTSRPPPASTSASISRDREESAYPSSSPAVAMNLLAGRGLTKRELDPTRSMTEPSSSGDFHDELLLPRARSVHEGLLGIPELDGPPTSTPALSNAAPPDPPPTIARPRPACTATKHTSPSINQPRALYQSSAVMRNRAPTPPRRSRLKDPMEDTQEPEAMGTNTLDVFGVREMGEDEGVMNGDLEPTQVEYDDGSEGGEKDMTIDVTMGAGRQRYQGEATDEKPDQSEEGDESATTPRPSGGAQKTSPTLLSSSEADTDSLATRVTLETDTNQLFPPAPSVRFIVPTTSGVNDQDTAIDPLTSSGVTTNSSQEVDHVAGMSLGLSEIGAMSSQPAPTQLEMPATQMYDIERLGPLSFGQQYSIDLARSLRSFEHDTTEAAIPPRAPPRGKKLERVPPPPTPSLVRAHMSKISNLETLDAQMDPTQVETCLSSPAVNQSGAEGVPSSIAASTQGPSNPSVIEHSFDKESTRPSGEVAGWQEAEGHVQVLVPPSEEPTQMSSAGPAPMEVDGEVFSEVGPSLPLSSRPPSVASSPVAEDRAEEPQPVVVLKKKQDSAKIKGKKRAKAPISDVAPMSDGPSSESFDPIDSLPRARVRRPSARLRESIGMNARLPSSRTPASTNPDVTLPPLPDLPTSSSLSSLPESVATSPAAAPETRSSPPAVEANVNAMSRPTKRRKTGTPTKAKKVPARRKSKISVGAKRAGAAASTSKITLDEAPASPPTVRFEETPNNHVEVDSSRTIYMKASEAASRDVKPNLPKSKLPVTAPFNRVFGLWRDNSWLYPATAISVSGGRIHARFDDGSKGNLKFSEVRRLKLQRGDWVRYVGAEAGDTETQVTTLAEDLRVYRIESEADGSDVQGNCERDDVVAVTPVHVPFSDQPELARRDQIQRLLVCAIAIPPQHTARFDDRRLTAVEIAGFEGKAPVSVKPPALLSIPQADKVEPLVVVRQDTSGSLFARMAFIVTSTRPEQEKRAFLDSMHSHGATVIDVQHLYTVETEGNKGGETKIKFQTDVLREIDTILLLADQPRTSPKFLAALALGIPCVSSLFVIDSIDQSARCDWKQYAISTGHVQSLNASSVYTQYRAMSRASFDVATLAQAHREGYGVFNGRSFLFVLPKTQIRSVLSIVVAAGATRFHVVGSTEAASSAIGYDHIVLEDGSKVPSGLRDHLGVASMTWVKQCLIAGRLLTPAMMRPVQVIEVGH
ncbi:BQ2448_2101 [Microbotryum intermedium]|uniref:BQ2448_2101 protein n=1 Tax=Microbotryum intermedium TaxID=269621 RepID=A0A238FAG7_9BASI|nr:BQ2448_2101 [Microbotryum intermedium]